MAKLFGLGFGATIACIGTVALYMAQAQSIPRPWPERSGSPSGLAEGIPDHGKQVANASCAACHGADGNSTDPKYPKLAGQDAAYLYRQLWAFKSGTRRSDIMAGIVAGLSDADMTDAAAFYSRQSRQPDAVRDPRLAAIGEHIFFTGMPVCAMCHGTSGQRGMPMMGMMGHGMMGQGMMGRMPMMGMMGNAPNLNGQHAGYIVDQLNRFASGERQAMMMGRIAATLSSADKRAVAEYLSELP
jgi:cytochrome c553